MRKKNNLSHDGVTNWKLSVRISTLDRLGFGLVCCTLSFPSALHTLIISLADTRLLRQYEVRATKHNFAQIFTCMQCLLVFIIALEISRHIFLGIFWQFEQIFSIYIGYRDVYMVLLFFNLVYRAMAIQK